MKIAIDVGHANGTGSRGNGLEEHEVCERLARLLAPLLVKQGHAVKVIDFPEMSNRDDLNSTIHAANVESFDFGISLHCDWSANADARGAHVCYYSTKGKVLAESLAEFLCALMPGRASQTARRTDLAVLKNTRPVWALAECGFISNAGDANAMKSNPGIIAAALAEGIALYCSCR